MAGNRYASYATPETHRQSAVCLFPVEPFGEQYMADGGEHIYQRPGRFNRSGLICGADTVSMDGYCHEHEGIPHTWLTLDAVAAICEAIEHRRAAIWERDPTTAHHHEVLCTKAVARARRSQDQQRARVADGADARLHQLVSRLEAGQAVGWSHVGGKHRRAIAAAADLPAHAAWQLFDEVRPGRPHPAPPSKSPDQYVNEKRRGDRAVRLLLAQNPVIPADLRAELCQDPDPVVADAARHALDRFPRPLRSSEPQLTDSTAPPAATRYR